MKAYRMIHISEAISIKALEMVRKYGVSNAIKPADALIASTAIVNNLLLFTDNTQDFDFIKELLLYK